MGRRFKNKKGKQDSKGNRGNRRPGKPINYADIVKENETYVKYYKAQNIVKPEEWDCFMNTIRDELPAAFRISRCCMGQTLKLRDMINDDSFSAIVNPDGNRVAAIAALPWDKDGLSFQFNYSRVEIRKSEALQRLHSFLVSESENGYITRQEAVSMIPPLLLDVQPHHKVLDACAAPGSKTAQIIEMLDVNLVNLECKQSNSSSVSSGMVVANDVDNKRCYMLVHQAKRLHSPCFVICNHDAGVMPNFFSETDGNKTKMKFDRILCDAPCTGDGTIRKNVDVWTKWTISNGNNFHGIQSRIGRRCLELLAKDGLMVYSTCSLNPMEDEAVVASLLNQCEGGVELVDVSERLPGLKYSPGIDTWVVMQKDMKILNSFQEVEENYRTQIRETMFPPENAKELNLHRCMRILPHYQNTGGFFVAVLRKKVEHLPWEKPKEEPSDAENLKTEEMTDTSQIKTDPPAKRARRSLGFREDPFYFFTEESEEWIEIKKFFKISDKFPVNQLVARSKGAKRNIYFVTSSAREIIINNESNIKFINAGVRLFCRADDKVCDVGYRITQEGLSSLFPYLDKENMVTLNATELALVMTQEMTRHEELEESTRLKLSTLPSGCIVAIYCENLTSKCPNRGTINHDMVVPLCIWKGKNTVRPFVSKSERIHFLRICGGDTKELEATELKKFQDKQERKQARLNERNQKQEQNDLKEKLETNQDLDSKTESTTC
ncbi:tRNA (cytosine(34)-C(5))-methyltransferase [Tetranychus urticae]|uniref:tRNA (cytosine(34)-C(5))-methyltransferase n=1 Tax=Tetranychus urticae TaxID=32264 RepID=T1KX57_TETUR|nr:tRNA (cytosine(34)-C(5))-methyltransferase [Tetranychus urticae]